MNLDILYQVSLHTTRDCPLMLWTLSQVCRSWRRLIEDHPSLWVRAGLALMFGSLKNGDYDSKLYNSKTVPFLYMAASLGHVRAAVYFIKGGYDCNYQSISQKCTPLILASQNSQLQLSRVLLEAGALVDLQDAMGMTAFLKASAHAMIPLCDLLIKHDCNINHQDRDGWTALHEACKQGNLKMAHYLVSHGAVANCQDHLLQTPLHVCVPFLNAGHMIRMLVVEARASLEIGDIHGKTPLHVAVDQGNAPICETLIELGADVNAQDALGDTPLHLAARHGNEAICLLLLRAGAMLQTKNQMGSTALEDAVPENLSKENLHHLLTRGSYRKSLLGIWLTLILFFLLIGSCIKPTYL